MSRLPFVVAAAAALLAVPAPQSLSQVAPAMLAPILPCPNYSAREPVLLYDVTGGTVAGPIHCSLSVYSDGSASYAKRFDALEQIDVNTRIVASEVVAQLAEDLADAGAFVLCDQKDLGYADLPLTTVTAFRGGTNARAHTFSFFDASANQFTAVQTVIQDFIDDQLASF